MPDYWGIAGYPISHSLTPRLFAEVGEHLGMSGAQQVFLEADGIDEFDLVVLAQIAKQLLCGFAFHELIRKR